jgi:hypothetical protein
MVVMPGAGPRAVASRYCEWAGLITAPTAQDVVDEEHDGCAAGRSATASLRQLQERTNAPRIARAVINAGLPDDVTAWMRRQWPIPRGPERAGLLVGVSEAGGHARSAASAAVEAAVLSATLRAVHGPDESSRARADSAARGLLDAGR